MVSFSFSYQCPDSSQDRAVIELLAGLADDCRTAGLPSSQFQSLPGTKSCHYNSDDEEAKPELDEEEAQLSLTMSQRWDSEPLESSAFPRCVSATLRMKEMTSVGSGFICHPPTCRSAGKEAQDGVSDEHRESSDDDMEWSANHSLFANLSIPQFDGAADESSGKTSQSVYFWRYVDRVQSAVAFLADCSIFHKSCHRVNEATA